MRYPNVRIRSTGSCVPARVVTNEQLEQSTATNAAWVVENLGIHERRIVDEHEFTSDLAARAGMDALDRASLSPDAIDLIIVATATPDRKSPSTACIVQRKIGMRNFCPGFDVAAVCSGFLYGMTIGAQFIQAGAYQRILVIGADTFSKITNWRRRDCVFFGDGAGAVVLEHTVDLRAMFSSVLYADGSGIDNFTVYPDDQHFTMNAKAVYDVGTNVLPRAITTLLTMNGCSTGDVSAVIPHQPSIRVLRKTAEALAIPIEKIKMNMDQYGNTAGASIPLLLDQVHKRGELDENDLIVFAAVGSGWTWGAALYRWI